MLCDLGGGCEFSVVKIGRSEFVLPHDGKAKPLIKQETCIDNGSLALVLQTEISAKCNIANHRLLDAVISLNKAIAYQGLGPLQQSS